MPSLRAEGAPPGGIVDVDLFASPGDAYALVVGLPAAPVWLADFAGAVWLKAPFVFGTGIVPPGARHQVALQLPNSPLLIGRAFTWQALSGSSTTRFTLSNPATYVHGF